jgi:DNA-binding GntR family transcriptional regulator
MPVPSTKISRRPLHDELAQLLRAMIVGGKLSPGRRISEQALCVRFGVSRTPLREALRVLSAERLVRFLPNKGAVVVRITAKEADDLVAVLGILQAFAGELACAAMDEPTMTKVLSLHNQMVAHFRRDEKRAYLELNHAIHEAIVSASGNEALIEIHRMLETRLGGVLSAVHRPPTRRNEAVEEHERMMAALESRDGAAFARIARQHIRHKKEIVSEAFDIRDRRSSVAERVGDGAVQT